jgi:hypothetical protein
LSESPSFFDAPLVPLIDANQANQINTAVFYSSTPTTYMTYSTTDDPGYVKDTGPRGNPTAADFEHNQPVKAVIGKPNLPKYVWLGYGEGLDF